MKARWKDVRQQRQVFDLGHRPVAIGEFQQIEIGIRDHHILGLAANPTSHNHVSVSRTRSCGIDVQADASPAFLAIATAATGDVKGYRTEVADFDKFDIPARLDHLPGDFVAQHQPNRSSGASTHHMLIATADIGGDYLKNDPMLALAIAQCEFWKIDGVNLHFPRSHVFDASVCRHLFSPWNCNCCSTEGSDVGEFIMYSGAVCANVSEVSKTLRKAIESGL